MSGKSQIDYLFEKFIQSNKMIDKKNINNDNNN